MLIASAMMLFIRSGVGSDKESPMTNTCLQMGKKIYKNALDVLVCLSKGRILTFDRISR
jgi:hypothetical protein